MATLPLDRYTLEEYLEMEDTLEYRSEFHDGIVLPVEAATPTHAQLEVSIGALLSNAFASRCRVYGSSLNLYIASANKVLHPDATVLCGEPHNPNPDCIDNPTILVEVTSPSTKDYDYGTKRGMYFSLPSLQHYLLVSQTERLVSHYKRSGEGWMYVDRGADGVIVLDDVQVHVHLQVQAIYAGIL